MPAEFYSVCLIAERDAGYGNEILRKNAKMHPPHPVECAAKSGLPKK